MDDIKQSEIMHKVLDRIEKELGITFSEREIQQTKAYTGESFKRAHGRVMRKDFGIFSSGMKELWVQFTMYPFEEKQNEYVIEPMFHYEFNTGGRNGHDLGFLLTVDRLGNTKITEGGRQ